MAEKRFAKWKPPVFDKKDMTKWNWMCQHHNNLKLGNRVDIGAFTYIITLFGIDHRQERRENPP